MEETSASTKLSKCSNSSNNDAHNNGIVTSIENISNCSSMQKAFQQPLLLDIILDYASRGINSKTQSKQVCVLRLVSKTWQQSLTKLLRKHCRPLFFQSLNEENSTNGTEFVRTNGKALDRFGKFLLSIKTSEADPIPSFSLNILEDFFVLENYNSFDTFLQQCGQGMTCLRLVLPVEGSIPCVFSNLALPLLHSFEVICSDKEFPSGIIDDEADDVGDAYNIVLLAQAIISSAENLKQVSFTGIDAKEITRGLQFINLPDSITTVEIGVSNKCVELQLLERNTLPKLSTLRITILYTILHLTTVHQIMNKYRQQLKILQFDSTDLFPINPPQHLDYLRFPVMETLEELDIWSPYLELETGIEDLSITFPKLRRLSIFDQTPATLSKWTSSSPVSTIKTFEIHLVKNLNSSNSETLPISVGTLKSIHKTFTNVTTLYLRILGTEILGLKYVFKEMTCLTSLSIQPENQHFTTSNHWDALFIGVKVGTIESLKAESKSGKKEIELNSTETSIRMLKDLKELYLRTFNLEDDESLGLSLISDLTFKFAWLKMPKLKHLTLSGKFKASSAMTEEWKKREDSSIYQGI